MKTVTTLFSLHLSPLSSSLDGFSGSPNCPLGPSSWQKTISPLARIVKTETMEFVMDFPSFKHGSHRPLCLKNEGNDDKTFLVSTKALVEDGTGSAPSSVVFLHLVWSEPMLESVVVHGCGMHHLGVNITRDGWLYLGLGPPISEDERDIIGEKISTALHFSFWAKVMGFGVQLWAVLWAQLLLGDVGLGIMGSCMAHFL